MLLVLLTAGCSAPPANSNATGNNNATAAATPDAGATAVTPQPAMPQTTSAPPTVSPAPTAQPAPATAKSAETTAKPAPADKTVHVEGPQFVLLSQEKELDFGKQPQDKMLIKAIRIKNGGTVPLNIQSVAPS